MARLVIGWLCDRFGPRLTYAWLLILGSLPVMGIGFAHDFQTFLIFRLLIGLIGASFVITQYHTSVMFAPNVVGTANAVTATHAVAVTEPLMNPIPILIRRILRGPTGPELGGPGDASSSTATARIEAPAGGICQYS